MTTDQAQPEERSHHARNPPSPSSPPPNEPDREAVAEDAPEIVDEVLIEEVGIDGMCGVY